MDIPQWAILAVFAVVAFFVAKATKGIPRYVGYIITLVLGGAAFQAAITDWRFAALIATIALVWFILVMRKRSKANRTKRDERQVRDAMLRQQYPQSRD